MAWNRSGTHKLVYHVTDDDGATTSEVLEVLVLNTPPIVRTTAFSCTAYTACLLDASSTLDAENDIQDLTVAWDVDVSVDSNEDGIPDNDADLIGKAVTHVFTQDGLQSVKVMAWDEDPERPGVKVITFAVLPADRTPLERIGAALVGEEASAVAQLSLLGAMLLLVLLFSRRRRKAEPTDAWDEVSETLTVGLFTDREEQIRQKRPEGPPPNTCFRLLCKRHPLPQDRSPADRLYHQRASRKGGRWSSGSTTASSIWIRNPERQHRGHSLLYQDCDQSLCSAEPAKLSSSSPFSRPRWDWAWLNPASVLTNPTPSFAQGLVREPLTFPPPYRR